MEITIKLDLNEVNGLLGILGKLPTETNIWPLAAKIRSQAESQLQPAAEAQEEPAGLTE
jgi:hypothetical protein